MRGMDNSGGMKVAKAALVKEVVLVKMKKCH